MSYPAAIRPLDIAKAQVPSGPAQDTAPHRPPQLSRNAARNGQIRNARGPAGQAYTIAHAGRQIRFGPVAFWIAVGTMVIMAGWSVTAATYLAFRDDVLRTLIARQAKQQFGYEDRIADLRAQIDRITSRQMLDQDQFNQKLGELMRRQAALESRATALNNLADPGTTGSIGGAAARPADPGARLRHDSGKQSSIEPILGTIEASLDRVEARQSATLGALENRYAGRIRRIRGVLDQIGVRRARAAADIGGPFVPVKLPPANEGFKRALFQVELERSEADQLSDTLRTVPLRQPLDGELEETSPFGVRMDPFMHQAAMHTGVDLRGEVGEVVHATAAGKVVIAGWDGGYGNMVEIDHGHGLSTRYGHLSQIDVRVGDTVRVGQPIGRVGSTGRSTGPHLHYETRIDGQPVNPVKFLDAGEKLFGDGQQIVRAGNGGAQD